MEAKFVEKKFELRPAGSTNFPSPPGTTGPGKLFLFWLSVELAVRAFFKALFL